MIIDEKKYPKVSSKDLFDTSVSLVVFSETGKCFYALHGNILSNMNNSYTIDKFNPDTFADLRVFVFEMANAPYSMNLAIRKQPMGYMQTQFEYSEDSEGASFFIFGMPYKLIGLPDNDTYLHTSYVKQWAVVASTFYGNKMLDLHADSLLEALQIPKSMLYGEGESIEQSKEVPSNWFTRLLGK